MTHDLFFGVWLLCLAAYCYLLGRGHGRRNASTHRRSAETPLRRPLVVLNPDFFK